MTIYHCINLLLAHNVIGNTFFFKPQELDLRAVESSLDDETTVSEGLHAVHEHLEHPYSSRNNSQSSDVAKLNDSFRVSD